MDRLPRFWHNNFTQAPLILSILGAVLGPSVRALGLFYFPSSAKRRNPNVEVPIESEGLWSGQPQWEQHLVLKGACSPGEIGESQREVRSEADTQFRDVSSAESSEEKTSSALSARVPTCNGGETWLACEFCGFDSLWSNGDHVDEILEVLHESRA